MNASPNRPASGQAQPDDVRLDQRQPVLAGSPAHASACSIEHRRVEVDAGDVVAGLDQRDGQPAGPDRELEDRPVDPLGEGEIQVEVAGVVGEVEVVQACEGSGGRGVGSVERWHPGVSRPSERRVRRGGGRRAR